MQVICSHMGVSEGQEDATAVTQVVVQTLTAGISALDDNDGGPYNPPVY